MIINIYLTKTFLRQFNNLNYRNATKIHQEYGTRRSFSSWHAYNLPHLYMNTEVN